MKFVWQVLNSYHGNWVPGCNHMYGLHLRDDPWGFYHRALVLQTEDDEWQARVWFINGKREYGLDKGVFESIGTFPTKLTAMRAARNIAKVVNAMNPLEEPEHE